MSPIYWISHFFQWASGADLATLRHSGSRTSRGHYGAIGFAILITAVFAALGMMFLLDGVFSTPTRFLVGVVWGLAIFNVDRLLVSTLTRRSGDRKLYLASQAIPRFILALLIAAAISEPLVVELFRDEIKLQIARDNLDERERVEARVVTRHRAALERLDQEEDRLRAREQELEDQVREAYREYIDEVEGTGGSMRVGYGPIAMDKRIRYEESLSLLEDFRREARNGRIALSDERSKIQDAITAEVALLADRAEAAQGFLRRHAALHRLKQDPEVGLTVSIRVWVFRGLIFCLEILPLWVKLLMRRSPYEAWLEHAEFEQESRADLRRGEVGEVLRSEAEFRNGVRAALEGSWNAALNEAIEENARSRSPLVLRLQRVVDWELDHTWEKAGFPKSPGVGGGDSGEVAGGGRSETSRPVAHHRSPWLSRRATLLISAAFVVLGILGTTFFYVAGPSWFRPCDGGPCPVDEWVERESRSALVLDRDGNPIGAFPRSPLPELDSLHPFVALAVAVEDQNFWRHRGVDPTAVVAAGVSNLRGNQRRGASTVTMQTVRCLDREGNLPTSGTWRGKLAETRVALDLEKVASKERILQIYLSCVELAWVAGQPIRGVEAASWHFFGKPAGRVSLGEAAMIIGMFKGPAAYNPRRSPDRALGRRNVSLQRLATVHPGLAPRTADAQGEPLKLLDHGRVPLEPPVISLLRRLHGEKVLTEQEVIQTSLHSGLQRLVEGELASLVSDLENQLPQEESPSDSPVVAGALIVDSAAGEVLAYACGRPDRSRIQWEPCLQGRVLVSSVGKVFLVLAGLEHGVLRPDDTLHTLNARALGTGREHPYIEEVCDRSAGRVHVDVRGLLADSDNCLALRIHQLLPVEAFGQLQAMGIEVEANNPASALGTGTISMPTLASLTAALANNGTGTSITALPGLLRVEDPGLSLPFRTSTLEQGRNLLSQVTTSGTGRSAGAVLPRNRDVFAKTGTAGGGNEYLMVGASGDRVLILWLGRAGVPATIDREKGAGAVLGASWGRIMAEAVEA